MAKQKAIMAEFARVRAYKTKSGDPRSHLKPANGDTRDGNGFMAEIDGEKVEIFAHAYIDGHAIDGLTFKITDLKVSKAGKTKSGKAAPTGLAALSPEQLAALSPEQIAAFNG